MKHYEIVFLVHPDQSEQVPGIVKRCSAVAKESGGKVHRTEDWGRRQLAYPIAKTYKAHYVLMNVECHDAALDEILEFFRFNEIILRNLITKVQSAVTKASPVKLADKQGERKWRDSEEQGDGRERDRGPAQKSDSPHTQDQSVSN